MPPVMSSEEVNALHLNSDKDSGPQALHHTLGTKPSQAAPGDHTHNGSNSARIKFDDLDGGWMNIDGGGPETIFDGLPTFDGGGV
jgi:hypothetical protein